ncbi:hypothetical protein Hdeb2414_s0432g00892531 [Helianthus debilis subsp. tardiflorus]
MIYLVECDIVLFNVQASMIIINGNNVVEEKLSTISKGVALDMQKHNKKINPFIFFNYYFFEFSYAIMLFLYN